MDTTTRCADLLILAAWSAELAARFEQLGQARRIRKVRGAWRRPALAGSAARLNRALTESYWRLATEVVASLRGRSDDVASGRLGQQTEAEAAVEFFGLTEAEAAQPVDRDRLAAVLLLLALWRRRHGAIAAKVAGEVFDAERRRALKQLGLGDLLTTVPTANLRAALLERYRADLDRLEAGLREGTARAAGVEAIVRETATVGEAAALLRRLFDEESFRIVLFSESLVWTAALDGYRAGSVEGNRELAALGRPLRRWVWVGPMDKVTCDPCAAMASAEVEATGLAELPAPSSICAYGIGCRHWWRLVE